METKQKQRQKSVNVHHTRMFLRSRGVWFGFAEKMFMFCSAKSRSLSFSEDDCYPTLNLYSFYEQWLVITTSACKESRVR